jgi:ethanolamine-phosphate cytidylyltransferase
LIKPKKEPVRIYVDGCFDLIHSGHYNAIRQAKALGDILVVGVNSDAEILKNKGPSVLNCKERADIIRACKWVDEVHEDTEYCVSVDVLDRYNCQYYAHGDDPCIAADGTDMCKVLSNVGRFKMFKRTEGVSTTDIVGKLLLLTKDNMPSGGKRRGSVDKPMISSEYVKEVRRIENEEAKKESSFHTPLSPTGETPAISVPNSHFLATTRRIMHFSNNREPKPTDKVIYI